MKYATQFRVRALLLVCLVVPAIASAQLPNLPCRTYGGSGSEQAYAIVTTPDRGYVLAGWTTSFGADTNALIVRLDSAGNPVGQARITPSSGAPYADRLYSIVRTRDSGYAVAGETRSVGVGTPAMSNVLVLRLDRDLNLLWGRVYGTTSPEVARSIIQTADGGFAVAGYRWIPSHWEALVLKLLPNGSLQWGKTYSDLTRDCKAFGIVEAPPPAAGPRYAIVGQETTGPGGMFKALRTIPVMLTSPARSSPSRPTPSSSITPTRAASSPRPSRSTPGRKSSDYAPESPP